MARSRVSAPNVLQGTIIAVTKRGDDRSYTVAVPRLRGWDIRLRRIARSTVDRRSRAVGRLVKSAVHGAFQPRKLRRMGEQWANQEQITGS